MLVVPVISESGSDYNFIMSSLVSHTTCSYSLRPAHRDMLDEGFEATPANLLTVPVYAVACGFTCLVGFLADRYGRRGYFNM